MSLKNNVLTIVSRKSNLALRQAEIVKDELTKLYPDITINIVGITTTGDEILDKPLNKIGGKGLFVSELEDYLLQDKADIAVHSVKDLPTTITPELGLGAILKRADPRDVFICQKYASIQELPAGSIVGTSSLRRSSQVLAQNSNVQIQSLRGNVETRLQKLTDGSYTAIILAAAGLVRLGLTEWLQHPLETSHMLPAIGQGALGIEYKLANKDLKQLLHPLNDEDTALCIEAERALNATLNGGCTAPIAGYATIKNGQLTLQAMVASLDGGFLITDDETGPKHNAVEIGHIVGLRLIVEGADKIIADAKTKMQDNGW